MSSSSLLGEEHFLVELASTILDAPHFINLLLQLRKNSTMIKGIPVENNTAIKFSNCHKIYLERLAFLRELEFLTFIISSHHRTLISNTIYTNQVKRECLFHSSKQKEEQVDNVTVSEKDISLGLASICSRIIPPLQSLFHDDGPIDNIQSVESSLTLLQSRTLDSTVNARTRFNNVALCLLRGSKTLWRLHESCKSLELPTSSISNRYVNTFSKYVRAVVESLYLKMQIVELETRLQVYHLERLNDLQEINFTLEGLIKELETTIKLGQTNLFLFQQLGPTVTNAAKHYQQLLYQIALVQEDISQLS